MESFVIGSSDEKTYGWKLMRLIVDGGTEALRNIFLNIHPGNLHQVLATHRSILQSLFKRRVIRQPQWDKLYPLPPSIPNIKEFDITLLGVLLRNICGLTPPSTGWNDMPPSNDKSHEANIVRLRIFRNNFFGHIPGTYLSRLDFEARWAEVSSVLLSLGFSQVEIERLKAEECGEQEVNRVRKEWSDSDKIVSQKLDGIKGLLDQMVLKNEVASSNDVLTEYLHCYDFEKHIEMLYERYEKGTREWVFNGVKSWLINTSSNKRAFIISGHPGMGKSIIAAAICKYHPEHVAGCHFFQDDNARYNNPRFFLQSLARQICNVLPEYEKNLSIKLSGNKGKSLDEMDIKGLFSWLYEEPFTGTNIVDPGKNLMIVIDALDECRQRERDKFVDLIVEQFQKLPSFIRFLITTRPEINISNKFEGLNPMSITRNDERNLKDITLYVANKLKKITQEPIDNSQVTDSQVIDNSQVTKSIVYQSEGLMLSATFLCELYEDRPITPLRGKENIYESYFHRLEREFSDIGIDTEKFLLVLSAIAVAKQPLPLPILDALFIPEENSSSAARTLLKLKSRISLLFIIKHDCVSFFHKSVRDWIVEPERGHKYKINQKCGHEALANVCLSWMKALKQNEVLDRYDQATQYALQHGIPHMLETINDVQFKREWLEVVIDLEIVHVSLSVDVYTTLNNLVSVANCKRLCEMKTEHERTKTLITIIRKFLKTSKDIPQSFLQYVSDENIAELSSKAHDLLVERYRTFKQDGITYVSSREKIVCVDISQDENHLVCGYTNGSVELFSLPQFKSLGKIFATEQNITSPMHGISRFVVFHPFQNVIFPGHLDDVLNFEMKFQAGPLKPAGEDSYTTFTNCCFTLDKEKMVTYYEKHLTFWDLVNNKEITSFSCETELYSMLFSANGFYLATTNSDGLYVYDTKKYTMFSRAVDPNPKVLISRFDSDSWYWKSELRMHEEEIEVVKCDLSKKRVSKGFRSLPMNDRAAQQCQALPQSDVSTLTDKLNDHSFFVLRDDKILAFRYGQNQLKLLKFIDLMRSSSSSL